MHQEIISPEQRASALASLRRTLNPESGDVDQDPHLVETARWLFTGLNTQGEPLEEASAGASAELTDHPGAIQSSLEGLTERYRAERLRSKADPVKTPLALMRVPSSVPDHDLAWNEGVKALVALGKPALAAQALEHHLAMPLHPKERIRVNAQWIDLLMWEYRVTTMRSVGEGIRDPRQRRMRSSRCCLCRWSPPGVAV